MRAANDPATVFLSKAELDLLKKLDFPGCESVVASARPKVLDEVGFELTGSHADLEDLARWVASEANHSRGVRKVALLDSILDKIECVV